MKWAWLTGLLGFGLVALHLWWRARLAQCQRQAEARIAALEQKQKQAAAEIETQQQALFNSMAEGLLVLDAEGRIEVANRAFSALFGITDDPRSRTILEVLRLHELADLVDSLGKEEPALEHEMRINHPQERWLQVNAAALFNGAAERQGTILVFHELTRIKQLERTRQEFVANVSHELRTPLSLIKGYVETLLGGAKDNPEVASRFLETIDRNAERLKLLIEDLLTISKLESGRMQLKLQPVSLKEIVDKVIADLKSRATAKDMQLVEQLPAVSVMGDADRLEQVFSNLVDNAIKYGRHGGTVVLSAKTDTMPALQTPVPPAALVEISIQDDGPGIPPDAIERVFERFYRVDKARSREQGGTGLGLAIVKHIVQSHGGRVWARSEPGKGATFFLTLRRAEQ